MRRRSRLLKQAAIESLSLAVEVCNRPHREARCQGVLLPLQHGLEMLLKAVIWQERRAISARGESRAYSFSESVGLVQAMGVIDADEARTLRMIGARRDAIQHAGSVASHDMVACDAMAGIHLADRILARKFKGRLADEPAFASRPLPLTTSPPKDYQVLISTEMQEVSRLLAPKSRKRAEAITRLRPFAAADVAARDKDEPLGPKALQRIARRVASGEDWRAIFPGLARLDIEAVAGHTYGFKIVKRGDAVAGRIVAADDPEAGDAVVIKEVDWFGRYRYTLKDLQGKLSGVDGLPRLSQWDVLAVIFAQGIRDDARFFASRTHGSQTIARYTPAALETIRAIASSPEGFSAAREAYKRRKR